jgi:hypothetical protein
VSLPFDDANIPTRRGTRRPGPADGRLQPAGEHREVAVTDGKLGST